MVWPRPQPRQAELVQPLADRALAYLDPEPARDLGAQIDAAPPRHLVPLRVGPRHHQGPARSSAFCSGVGSGARPGLGRERRPATPPSS
jgi:hypothetical protein